MPVLTINDVRLAGHCTLGARTWFETNGFTREQFRQFLRPEAEGGGLPIETLLSVEDNGLVVQVIERKVARENG